ncbi:MAG: urea ABC transporter permease subunit UrtB [Pseudomonadota bacterium]
MTFLRLLLAAVLAAASAPPALAQDPDAPVQRLLQENGDQIAKPSRRTIGPVIDALAASGLPEMREVLERWQGREMWRRKKGGLFVFGEEAEGRQLRVFDPATGAEIGVESKRAFRQLKPNSGVRGLIGSALVRFRLSDPDPAQRTAALEQIERRGEAVHLPVLRAVMDDEGDAALAARMARAERILTIAFDADEAARIAAIRGFAGDTGVDVRAALNPLLAAAVVVSADGPPEGANVARRLTPGEDLPRAEALDLLAEAGAIAPPIDRDARDAALEAAAADGRVAGVEVASLSTEEARDLAYAALARAGEAAAAATPAEIETALAGHAFYEVYRLNAPAVTAAARETLESIEVTLGLNQTADLALDALSLASIYFLAAIGLAITFGVMGVINMAHGEFIMMGAYTGYVVQLFVPDYTVSILIALPLAFAITFGAGVAMERLVIRWLYHRPLETLLATFGISIALQQLAKNIFGTQARPLTSPDWLSGAWAINDVVAISWIRIAIFVLALLILALLWFILNRTRLGLEVRAVTQNPRMAGSMGINPNRINMLTFGLGSGIAGIAGVAIGLFAQVTSELGQGYIVQSFMTVVVGGVGNIWGTLAGALMIGGLQKGIEWLNPSNTLAAQTYMILFIILFIQFRPKGIFALRGRAAEA